MVASVVEPKDPDIIHLAPHERPLSAAALARLKHTIREELQRQIHSTLQKSTDASRALAIQRTLLQLFGMHRSMAERRLFYLFAAPLVRDLILQAICASRRRTFRGVDVLALDVSLRRLDTFAPRQARMIDLHYFAGFSLEETADLLGLTMGALGRELRFVKAWLANVRQHRDLAGQQ